MTHCECSASLASEMVLCSSSNLACGALWINRQRLMSHVLPCSLQTVLTGGGGERRAWKGSCFGNTLIWLSHLFVSGSETRFFIFFSPSHHWGIHLQSAVSELSRGNYFFASFSPQYFSYPEGSLVNLPSPTYTDSREHVHPHVTEAINSHGPHHRDKASEQSIKQTKPDDDSGGMLRNDAI